MIFADGIKMWIYYWSFSVIVLVYGRPDLIEDDALEEILNNYNKLARPATVSKPTVTVKHGLNLVSIKECDGQTLKAETWLEMTWVDPRLEWSLDDYNIKSLSLPSDLFWIPDIVLYNNPASHAGNAYNPRVTILHNGTVSWFPPTTIFTNCDESDHDSKIVYCFMTFGSWSYDGKAVDIQLKYNNIELRDYHENSAWEYVNSTVVRNMIKYPCCPELYADVTYTITLRRRDQVSDVKNGQRARTGETDTTNTPDEVNANTENVNKESVNMVETETEVNPDTVKDDMVKTETEVKQDTVKDDDISKDSTEGGK